MEFLGEVNDISIPKGYEGKIKIRTIDKEKIVIDKIELIINKAGSITKQ